MHTSRKFYFPTSQTIFLKNLAILLLYKVQLRNLASCKFYRHLILCYEAEYIRHPILLYFSYYYNCKCNWCRTENIKNRYQNHLLVTQKNNYLSNLKWIRQRKRLSTSIREELLFLALDDVLKDKHYSITLFWNIHTYIQNQIF